MATMPIRELIDSLRIQVTKLPSTEIIRILFVNIMLRRLEEEANRADIAEQKLKELIDANS